MPCKPASTSRFFCFSPYIHTDDFIIRSVQTGRSNAVFLFAMEQHNSLAQAAGRKEFHAGEPSHPKQRDVHSRSCHRTNRTLSSPQDTGFLRSRCCSASVRRKKQCQPGCPESAVACCLIRGNKVTPNQNQMMKRRNHNEQKKEQNRR